MSQKETDDLFDQFFSEKKEEKKEEKKPEVLKTIPDALTPTASDVPPDLTKDVAAIPVKEPPKADAGFDFDFGTPAETGGAVKSASESSPFVADVAPPAPPQPPTSPSMTETFDYSDAPKNKLMILTVYGLKGPGKTYSSFCLDGSILCISFDRKSETVHSQDFNDDPRIVVKWASLRSTSRKEKDLIGLCSTARKR